MGDLIKRSRSAMNLLGLFSILFLVGLLNTKPDIKSAMRNTYELIVQIPSNLRTETMVKFLNKVDTRNVEITIDDQLAAMPVSVILELIASSEKDMYSQRMSPEQIQIFRNLISVENIDDPSSIRKANDILTIVSLAMEPIKPDLLLIKTHIEESKLLPSHSIKDLVQKYEDTISLPFVKQEVYLNESLHVVILTLIAITLYLLSVVLGIIQQTQDHNSTEGLDWLFFHPGYLGFSLGAFWVSLPILLLIYWVIDEGMIEISIALLLTVCFALSLFVINKIWIAKKLFLESTQCLTKE